MHIILGLSCARDISSTELDQIVERCEKRLPKGIDWKLELLRCPRAATLVWSNVRAVGKSRLAKTDRSGFAYSGYVTAEDDSAGALLAQVSKRRSRPGFDESPGGIASFFHMDLRSGRLTAWASRPMVCALYYGRANGIAVVSTRPLMAACALGQPRRNDGYARAALAAGFPLGRETPFDGIEAVESGEAAELHNGSLKIQPYTPPAVTTHGDNPFQEELLRAVSAIERHGENEFRLSGGKDSRLVAAAAYRLGIKVHAMSRGADGWGEVQLANRVADALGFAHSVEVPLAPSDYAGAMKQFLLSNDGVTNPGMQNSLNEANFYPTTATSLTMGHSHLQRGGWAIVMRTENLREPAYKTILSPFVRPEVNDKQRTYIDRWFEMAQPQEPAMLDKLLRRQSLSHIPTKSVRRLDYLFWSYEFFRVAKYLQKLRLFYEPHMLCVWPLLDERFIRACAGIKPYDRTREYAVFASTTELAPQLRDIPLFDDRYRFEKGGRDDRFGAGYEARDPSTIQNDEDRMKGAGRFYLGAPAAKTIKETVLSSSFWRDIRNDLSDETIFAVESIGARRRAWNPPAGVKKKEFVKLAWWLFAQSTAESVDW